MSPRPKGRFCSWTCGRSTSVFGEASASSSVCEELGQKLVTHIVVFEVCLIGGVRIVLSF